MELLGQQIECPIVGLPLAFVGHGDHNRRVPFPPHQGTFVFEQHDHFSPLNLAPPRLQFFQSPPAVPAPVPRSV